MDMIIEYNGTDISDMCLINKAVHEMYLGYKADFLEIRFDNQDNMWTMWKPKEGDRLRLKAQHADTGKLIVSEVLWDSDSVTLYASSLGRSDFEFVAKSWEQVYLKQLIEEIAARHSYTAEYYGIKNQLYQYVEQQENDFAFLQKRLYLEDAAVLVFNRKMIVYGNDYFKEIRALTSLNLIKNMEYRLYDDQIYGASYISNGKYDGKCILNMSLPAIKQKLEVNIGSIAEAERYARNILNQSNRNYKSWIKFNQCYTELMAGSVIELNSDIQGWNANVLINRVRQDYKNNCTKIWIGKV